MVETGNWAGECGTTSVDGDSSRRCTWAQKEVMDRYEVFTLPRLFHMESMESIRNSMWNPWN